MLLPFLWIAAFFFSLPLVEPYEIARLLAVFCAGGAAGLTVVRGHLPRWSPLLAVAASFWLLAGVSAGLSDIRYVSFVSFCTFSLMPLSALAFVAAPEKSVRVARAGAGILLGALALWALAQYLFFTDMLVFGQVRHPFANPNAYAALLAAGVLPAAGMAMGAQGRARVAALLLAALLTCAVVVIGGRAVTVLLAGALVVFFMLMRGHGRGRAPQIAVVAAAALGLLLAATGDHAVLQRLAAGVAGEAEGFGRGPVWAGAAAIFADHALTGTGIGTFSQYYPGYRLPADTASGGYMAHSDPLQFASEMGFAAPLLFYAFIALALLRMKRAGEKLPWATGLFCGLGILAAHAHVDFDFYVAPILCLAGLMLAAWYRETGVPPAVAVTGWRWAVIVPMLAALFLLQGLLLGEYQLKTARAQALAGDMAAFGATLNKAHTSAFGMNAQAYVMAATVPIGLMHGARPGDRPALYAQAMDLLARAEALNPRLPSVPFYRAQAAALYRPAGEPPPEYWLRAVLVLDPRHTESRVMLARRLSATGQGDEAYAVLRAGLDWPYAAPAAQDYLDEIGAQALRRQDMDTYNRMSASAKRLEERLALPAWMATR